MGKSFPWSYQSFKLVKKGFDIEYLRKDGGIDFQF